MFHDIQKPFDSLHVTSYLKLRWRHWMPHSWHSMLMMMSYILFQGGGCDRVSWHLAALVM
jgi:hypothetical protein